MHANGIAPETIASIINLTVQQIQSILDDAAI